MAKSVSPTAKSKKATSGPLRASVEVWRPIPSAPGYQASSKGRICSPHGRILSTHAHIGGYRRCTVLKSGDRIKHKRLVHRLVCEAFHGPAPSPDHVAAHWNDIGDDNRPNNLRWATQAENVDDLRRNGNFYSFGARAS